MKYKYKDIVITPYSNGYRIYLPTNNPASGQKYFLCAFTTGTKKTAYNIGKDTVNYLNNK